MINLLGWAKRRRRPTHGRSVRWQGIRTHQAALRRCDVPRAITAHPHRCSRDLWRCSDRPPRELSRTTTILSGTRPLYLSVPELLLFRKYLVIHLINCITFLKGCCIQILFFSILVTDLQINNLNIFSINVPSFDSSSRIYKLILLLFFHPLLLVYLIIVLTIIICRSW